jgi:pimeloyl-ACP methyl ester carboxylesterase
VAPETHYARSGDVNNAYQVVGDRVPNTELPTLEQRMDDVRAVMDAVGSERAALMGISEGGPMCLLFGATYPERTTALIMLVKDLVAGAGIEFDDRGAHDLKGVPGEWRVYAVRAG